MSFILTELPLFAELEKALDHLDPEAFDTVSPGDFEPAEHETPVATLSLPLYRLFLYHDLVGATALAQLARLNSLPEAEVTEEKIRDCEALLQQSEIVFHLFWCCFQVEFPSFDIEDQYAFASTRWVYRRSNPEETFTRVNFTRGLGPRLMQRKKRS